MEQMKPKHSHYFRIWNGMKLDIYRLLSLFNVECPNAQHVAKKAICAGQRGHKDLRKDWEDIRDTAIRKLEMLDEDAQFHRVVEVGKEFR